MLADGSPVATPASWPASRVEILELFRDQVFGRAPTRRAALRFKAVEDGTPVLDGLAIRRQVRIHIGDQGAEGRTIDLLIYAPAKATAFLACNYHGSVSIHSDPGIRMSDTWMRKKDSFGIVDHRTNEKMRGVRTSRWAFDWEQYLAFADKHLRGSD